MARVLDIGATFDAGSYLISSNGPEADARAWRADWNALQQDLIAAMEASGQTRAESQTAAA